MTHGNDRGGGGSGTKCPVCGKQTFGVYNTASKLVKRLAEKKEKEKEKARADVGAGARRRGGWEVVIE